MDMHLFTWLGGLTIATIIWAVRLEGRVNSHDRAMEDQRALQNERHEDNKGRLERIERKIDSLPLRLNGSSSPRGD